MHRGSSTAFWLCAATFAFAFIWRAHADYALGAGGFDGAVYTQSTWLLSQGKTGHLTVHDILCEMPVLGNHFPVILFAIAPFYRLWPDPRFLLTVGVIAVAATGFPIYLYARDTLKGHRWGLLVSAAYFLWPPTHYLCRQGFYVDTLAMPFLAGCFYLAEKNRSTAACLMAGVAFACKEMVGLTVAAIGLLSLLRGNRRLGAVLVIAGILWTALLVFCVIPPLNGGRNFHLALLRLNPAGSGAAIGSGVVVKSVLDRGLDVYLLQLLSLGFFILPLLGFEALIPAIPMIAAGFLSDTTVAHRLLAHYLALVLPFLLFAVTRGMARLSTMVGKWSKAPDSHRLEALGRAGAASVLLLSSLTPHVLLFTVSPERLLKPPPRPLLTARRQALNHVPADASVSAQPTMVLRLANRDNVFVFPAPFVKAAFDEEANRVVLKVPDDLRDSVGAAPVGFVLLDESEGHWPINQDLYARVVNALERSSVYRKIFDQEGVKVYRSTRHQEG